jgi:hypothetical protein
MRTRIILIILAVTMLVALVACNPSQQALWEKNKATGYGGLTRHIVITDAITGKVIYDKTGRCFIADGSKSSDISILWIGERNKKDDILGAHMIMVAEEQ